MCWKTKFEMERYVFTNLKDWIKKSGRKPLLLRGARQVGKTWIEPPRPLEGIPFCDTIKSVSSSVGRHEGKLLRIAID